MKKNISLCLFSLTVLLGTNACQGPTPTAVRNQTVSSLSQAQGWQELKSMPEPRYNLQASLLKGKIYTSGGFNDANILDSFERFDPETGQWEILPPMPAPRYIHAAASLNDELYLMGGYQFNRPIEALLKGDIDPKGAIDRIDRYSPVTGQWQALAPMPSPRFMAMAASLGGKIYLAGGGGINRQLLDSMDVYDPASNTWSSAAPLPEARAWGELISDGRYLYVLGGMGANQSYPTAIHRYDAQTNTWKLSALPPLPEGRGGLAATWETAGITVAGGANPNGFSQRVDFLDLGTGQWQALPPISPGRGGLDLVRHSRGLYLFGTDAWYTNNSLFLSRPGNGN